MTINFFPAVNVEKLYEDNGNLKLSYYYLKMLSEMKIIYFPSTGVLRTIPTTPISQCREFFHRIVLRSAKYFPGDELHVK